ncbi:MAG: DUF5063 domain-containing protein [Acidobacteriota bacterium]|nr:DUF5063 domain-containing protein [Acidobacteriota bacterium]
MDEQIKTKVEHFAEIVRRYCAWAETSSVDVNADMQTAQRLLAELHLAVLDLPDDEFEDDVELEDITAEQWKTVRERFANLQAEGYWTVFDPTKDQENETVFALLSDDLADIYRDIKYGLLVFDTGHIAEATWEWKFNFKIHWGRHLLDAQKVIYSWISNNGEL